MVSLESYLNDGACPQAIAVLGLMKAHADYILDRFDAELFVGRYENCREQGYVFTIRYKGLQRNYAVYQHRNSDALCVLISNVYTIGAPQVDEMWADKGENATKYDVDAQFGYAKVEDCANFIERDMLNFLKDNESLNEEPSEEQYTMEKVFLVTSFSSFDFESHVKTDVYGN